MVGTEKGTLWIGLLNLTRKYIKAFAKRMGGQGKELRTGN